MTSRIRRVGMTSKAVLYAIVIHIVAAVLLVLNLDWPAHILSAQKSEPAPVQASVVSAKEIQAQEEAIKQKDEAKKQQELEAKKKLEELLNKKKKEEQRLANLKKQQEEEQKKADEYKKKKEQEKQELAKLQQQQERKKAEAEAAAKKKQQEEAAKKRKEEAAKKAAEEQRKKELQAQLEQEQLQKRVNAALAQYIPIIRQKVSRNWNLPEGVQNNIEVHVNVRLSPDGEVLSAQIVKSSGNPVFDRSVENAVLKASPLPIPQEQGVNEEFRNLTLKFKPEELVS
ncbi:MAG: cell envelope integrity protein TolA [Arenicellales bacterium]